MKADVHIPFTRRPRRKLGRRPRLGSPGAASRSCCALTCAVSTLADCSGVSAIAVGDLLGRLKPAQAAVIRLVKLQGYSINDAAEATGQCPSLVKVNVHRGLSRLRTVMTAAAPAAA